MHTWPIIAKASRHCAACSGVGGLPCIGTQNGGRDGAACTALRYASSKLSWALLVLLLFRPFALQLDADGDRWPPWLTPPRGGRTGVTAGESGLALGTGSSSSLLMRVGAAVGRPELRDTQPLQRLPPFFFHWLKLNSTRTSVSPHALHPRFSDHAGSALPLAFFGISGAVRSGLSSRSCRSCRAPEAQVGAHAKFGWHTVYAKAWSMDTGMDTGSSLVYTAVLLSNIPVNLLALPSFYFKIE